MPPRTIKRKVTTNLKTKNNQNCQKIELYGSLSTKELKKKHLPRHVGGAETGSWVESTHSKVAARGLGWVQQQLVDWAFPHLCADKPGGTTGEQDRPCNPGFRSRELKLQNL